MPTHFGSRGTIGRSLQHARQPRTRRTTTGGNRSGITISLSFINFVLIGAMILLLLLYVYSMTLLTHYSGGQNAINSTLYDANRARPKIVRKTPLDTSRHHPQREAMDVISTPHTASDYVRSSGQRRILTAYLEPVDQSEWKEKPLPTRTPIADDLTRIQFSGLNSCSRLAEQWPVDNFPDADPFLPWIHDVFPTQDGKFIQFVAQNKRRCVNGEDEVSVETTRHLAPQVALFQHVPVQRVKDEGGTSETRYRLVPHDQADPDGVATRFVCRFSNGEETLSVFNFSYEWAVRRRKMKVMFHEEGGDNKQFSTSQLLFKCPVPETLVETVRTGVSVQHDYATLFVDVVPIRTPPRYGAPDQFLPPYYKEFERSLGTNETFDPSVEWGENHVLPKVEVSGRWENIPICKPSLLTYGKHHNYTALTSSDSRNPVKEHRLISCLWASATYATRGDRFAVDDGHRRFLEWITYNKLIGVEHFYLYDNSGAFSSETSLKPIADLFPNEVTVINWPAKVCNNEVGTVGERSSQYAAEASCRLRFGPHTEWIAQFDIDEYLIPMGETKSVHELLDKLDNEGMKIISFGSWRAWPRRSLLEDPNKTRMSGKEPCGFQQQSCFQPRVPFSHTLLQTYNCDQQLPGHKSDLDPAEKQIYRADYVFHHFVHYSAVTALSALNTEDVQRLGRKWNYRNKDELSRFSDEVNEALMLHAKSVAMHETNNWEKSCLASYNGRYACQIGTPYPDNTTVANITHGDDQGWKFNCYVNRKIEDYWVNLLERELAEHMKIPSIAKLVEREEATDW